MTTEVITVSVKNDVSSTASPTGKPGFFATSRERVWDFIKAAVRGWYLFGKRAFMAMLKLVRTMVSATWTFIYNAVTATALFIKSAVKGVWGFAKSILEGLWIAVTAAFQAVWDAIGASASAIWGAISSFFETAWEAVESSARVSWIALEDACKASSQFVEEQFSSTWAAMTSAPKMCARLAADPELRAQLDPEVIRLLEEKGMKQWIKSGLPDRFVKNSTDEWDDEAWDDLMKTCPADVGDQWKVREFLAAVKRRQVVATQAATVAT